MSRTGKVLLLSSTQLTVAMISIVSGAILTRVLPKAEFASYRQAMLAFSFAAPFVVLGLDNALYAIMPRHPERARGILVENLLLLGSAGLLLTIFIAVGGNQLLARRFDNPSLATLVLWLAPYALVFLPTRSVASCLMAREQTPKLAGYNTLTRLILLPCVVIPAFLRPDAVAPLLGQVAGAGISLMIGLKFMTGACDTGSWRPTVAGIKEQLRFAIPVGLAGLAGTVGTTLDHVVVSSRFSPEIYAVYAVGAFELPVVGIFTGAMTSVLLVEYSRLHARGENREIVRLVHQAMAKSAMALLPIMVLFLIVAPSLMAALYGEGYRDAAGPFRWYLLRLPLRTLTFGALLMAAGRGRDVLIAAVGYTLAAGAFAWMLTGPLGAAGSACGMTVADYVVSAPVLLLAMRRCLGVPIAELLPWRRLAHILLVSLTAGVPAMALAHWLYLPSVPLLILCGAAYLFALAFLMPLSGLVRLEDIRLRLNQRRAQSSPA